MLWSQRGRDGAAGLSARPEPVVVLVSPTAPPSPPHSSRGSGLVHTLLKKYSSSEVIYALFKSLLRAVSSGKIQGFPLTASKQALIYASPIGLNSDIGLRNLLVQRPPKKPKSTQVLSVQVT